MLYFYIQDEKACSFFLQGIFLNKLGGVMFFSILYFSYEDRGCYNWKAYYCLHIE